MEKALETDFNTCYSRLELFVSTSLSPYSPLSVSLRSFLSYLDSHFDDPIVQRSVCSLYQTLDVYRAGLDASIVGTYEVSLLFNSALSKLVDSTIHTFVHTLSAIGSIAQKELREWGISVAVGLLGMDYVESFDLNSLSINTRIPVKNLPYDKQDLSI